MLAINKPIALPKSRQLIKYDGFRSRRMLAWYYINLPFNPKEPWRRRPRALASPAASLEALKILDLHPLDFVPEPLLKNMAPLLKMPKMIAANPLVSQVLNFNYTPYFTVCDRIDDWFTLTTRTFGFFTTLKLKYKGKSFRWHRKGRALMLRFGHSHLVVSKPRPDVYWRKHGRQKIIFWGTNKWSLQRFLKLTTEWRPMNIYHGRGLRLTKQKVWRKAGKVSAYR